ncbi:MAG TPA: RNA polymerase sigma factor [Polyangiales bacterium]|nr:RNA polymerase sigma factor [Polyangiales bacterium]
MEELSPLDCAMSRYADGDDAAFPAVYAALAPRIRGLLRRLCGSDVLAHDLTQETLLRMHRARATFTRDRRALPWAYAIARNCYVSHLRLSMSRRSAASLELARCELVAGPDSDAEQTVIARQFARTALHALADMSATQRDAYVQLRCEERSVADAAIALGATQNAVKLRASRAYQDLRAALRSAAA